MGLDIGVGPSHQATTEGGRISADATLADIIAWAAKHKQDRTQNSGLNLSLTSDRMSIGHTGQSLSGSGLSSVQAAGATGADSSDDSSQATPAQKSRESLSTLATRLLSLAHRSAVPQQSNPRMETKMLSVYKMANFWGYATAPHPETNGHDSRASSPRAGTVEGDSDSEYTRPTPTCERGAATIEPRLCRTFEESIGSALSVRTLARRLMPASPPRAENAVSLSRMLAELESADLTIPEAAAGPAPVERLDSPHNGSFGSTQSMIQQPPQMLHQLSRLAQPHPWQQPPHPTAATQLYNSFQQFSQGYARDEAIGHQLHSTQASSAAMSRFDRHSLAAHPTVPSQSQPNPVLDSINPRAAFQTQLRRSAAAFPSDAPAVSGWQWALAPHTGTSAASTTDSKVEDKQAELIHDTSAATASAQHHTIGPALAPRATIPPSANDSKKQAARARRPASSAAPGTLRPYLVSSPSLKHRLQLQSVELPLNERHAHFVDAQRKPVPTNAHAPGTISRNSYCSTFHNHTDACARGQKRLSCVNKKVMRVSHLNSSLWKNTVNSCWPTARECKRQRKRRSKRRDCASHSQF